MNSNLIFSAQAQTPFGLGAISIPRDSYTMTLGLRPLIPGRPGMGAASRIQIPASGINTYDAHGKAPLHRAIEQGNLEQVATLLQLDADPNLPVLSGGAPSTPPLHLAIEKGQFEAFELLLDHPRIDVNRKDRSNRTPLLTAISAKRADMVAKLVIMPGIDVNARGDHYDVTPLFLAAMEGRAASAMHLLNRRDIDINKKVNGTTPMEIAIANGENMVLDALLQRATKAEIKQKNQGETPLAIAKRFGNGEAASMIYRRLGGIRGLFH